MSAHRIAMIMPGMGSYLPGSLRHLRSLPSVGDTLTEIDEAVGDTSTLPPSQLLTDPHAPDAAELVDRHELAFHLAIYAGSLAVFRLLEHEFGVCPEVVMGHSLGDVAAFAAAGVYAAGDGARLLLAREIACAAYPTDPAGMLVLRLPPRRTMELLSAAQLPGLDLACDNANHQSVVSGPERSLDTFAALARRQEVSSAPLTVRTLLHNRLREPAAAEWRRLGADIVFRPPTYPVFSCVLGRDFGDEREFRDGVVDQLRRPVRFRSAARTLHERGIRLFLETGSYEVLGACVRAEVPQLGTLLAAPAGVDAEQVWAALCACGVADEDSPTGPTTVRTAPAPDPTP
jgi:acyl transferase domain-containing protein